MSRWFWNKKRQNEVETVKEESQSKAMPGTLVRSDNDSEIITLSIDSITWRNFFSPEGNFIVRDDIKIRVKVLQVIIYGGVVLCEYKTV